MDAGPMVCGHCTVRIQDPSQRVCSRCLEELSVRRFTNEEQLEAFREDRRAHGAPVPDEKGERRTGVALAFGFIAAIMLMAGAGIMFSGIVSGSVAQATRSFGEAFVPLAIGLALAVVAREYGGKGS